MTLGRIGGPHGVRGCVRVQSFARPPESILEFGRWWLWLGDRWQRRAVRRHWLDGERILAALEGCERREDAAALRHAEIAVEYEELPALAPGEWYWQDLIGLSVETVDGVGLGRVERLIETGANDVLVVAGERERLIPWVDDAVIRAVEPEGRGIVVDWDPSF